MFRQRCHFGRMPSRRSESLSERDKQTLELLAEGLTQREIDERVAKLHDDDLDANAVRWSECCDFREAISSIADYGSDVAA